MNKDTVPENFTLSLAAVDSLPVILFSAAMLLIAAKFSSALFLIGACMIIFAGVCKVLWKFIIVLKKKNIWWMFLQMRILMPVGFVIIILAVLLNRNLIDIAALWQSVTSFPSLAFFLIGILGMVGMTVSAFMLDSKDPRSNWIEQLINSIAQAGILLGVIFL